MVLACIGLQLRTAVAQNAAPEAAPQQSPSTATATPVAVPADLASQNIAIITIREPIDRYTSMSFKRRLAKAEAAGADCVVVELDTPGGELGAVLEICELIE